jgi:malate synthase
VIPAYVDFLTPTLSAALLDACEPTGVPGLTSARGLQQDFPELESAEVLGLVVEVYRAVAPRLAAVLSQRTRDRAFLDGRCAELVRINAGKDITDPAWRTPIGEMDEAGRVVLGPQPAVTEAPFTAVPPFLRGHQVTLFGPPDSARMAINAMNAVHRRRPDEPAIVNELVGASVARWGADSEDSKTPRLQSLYEATRNLAGCFDGTLEVNDEATGRRYALADGGRSLPIKRVAGLALPDGNHFLDGAPLPLHLLELVQHAWLHRARPEALVFYFPKLENEEEAAYLAALLRQTEAAIALRDEVLRPGTLRVLVVFENPRAIFRIQEMAAALHPWFLGGSLGWHDFLASTARIFRNDPGYRIPVKADPNIVIRNIRESHRILVRELGPSGAMKLGGMYGILPDESDPHSYAVTMVGFVRDVATQLKRGLDGFWVAHPDFVRLGIALCEAWRRRQENANDTSLRTLVTDLVADPDELAQLLPFVFGPDVEGLEPGDPSYLRAVLAAERGVSPVIANDDLEEVRYNIFQALQYLADWLAGNGCVALPASLRSARGESVAVRVMDDLATTERSRWELWAEVAHGRVSRAQFNTILAEEVDFLSMGRSEPGHRPQVRWEGEAVRWYPIAVAVLRQLVLSPNPPEFVTELVLPFSFDLVRSDPDPWARACALCPGRFESYS